MDQRRGATVAESGELRKGLRERVPPGGITGQIQLVARLRQIQKFVFLPSSETNAPINWTPTFSCSPLWAVSRSTLTAT